MGDVSPPKLLNKGRRSRGENDRATTNLKASPQLSRPTGFEPSPALPSALSWSDLPWSWMVRERGRWMCGRYVWISIEYHLYCLIVLIIFKGQNSVQRNVSFLQEESARTMAFRSMDPSLTAQSLLWWDFDLLDGLKFVKLILLRWGVDLPYTVATLSALFSPFSGFLNGVDLLDAHPPVHMSLPLSKPPLIIHHSPSSIAR